MCKSSLQKDHAEMQIYFAAIQMIDAAILIWSEFPELLKSQEVYALTAMASDIKSIVSNHGGR